jgi:hypothetical protein
MSKAKIIAKLVEAGHEDLAEQLLSGTEEARAAAVGETFPNAVVAVGTDTIAFVCKVQIAWAGATITDAKQRLDKAGKAVMKATDSLLKAAKKDDGPTANHVVMDRSPAGPMIQNNGKHRHLMNVVAFWHYGSSFSPEQLDEIKQFVKAAGLKLD